MSLPLLGMLRAASGVVLSVMAPRYTARVFWGVEGVDELTVVSPRGRLAGVWHKSRMMRRLGADAAVILPASFSSALSPFLAGVGVRAGYRSDGRWPMLTESVSPAGARDEHLSNNYRRLGAAALSRLGIDIPEAFEVPSVTVSPQARRAAASLLSLGSSPLRDYVVVVPGATFGPAKAWPQALFRETVSSLSPEVPVVVAGGHAERELCAGIARGLTNVRDISGRTTQSEFFAVLERASLVIANDSGSPHVAASLGVPVIVLFGSTSPTWTAPLGPAVDVIRFPVHCSPCFRRTCPTQLECFNGIEPVRVLERARRALQRRGTAEKGVADSACRG